jgi:hypothetical protein
VDCIGGRRKVGSIKTAADFFKRRAGKANAKDLLWILDKAPEKPPVRGGEKK